MTYKELSDSMDVLSNRYAAMKDTALIPFDEYEKSLFITLSASGIVKEMLPFYDRNEKIKKQLISITRSAQVGTIAAISNDLKLRSDSIVYELPSDVLYVVAESLRSASNVILSRIKPLKDDEAYYTFDNPFRSSKRGYAWRNGISIDTGGIVKKYSEIITSILPSALPKYFLKYICNVPVFVVTDNLEDASINGISVNANLNTEAPLSILHEKILDRAIIIGYMSKTDDPNSKVSALGLSKDS